MTRSITYLQQVQVYYWALILLGFALLSEHLCVFCLHDAIYIYILIFFCLHPSLYPFGELSLVGLVLDLVN